MGSITRIGHPSFRPGSDEKALVPSAPKLFDIPTKSNYHTSTGFGKPFYQRIVVKALPSHTPLLLLRAVHCCVTRVGDNVYHLTFQVENADSVSAIAKKIKSSRTSTYHLFDALRGGANAKLTKKAGHYIGKLRRDKGQPVGCYTLYNSSREKEQVATYVYDVPGLMKQVTEGQPPRRMQVIIPKGASLCDEEEQPLRDSGKVGRGTHRNNQLMELLHNGTWKQHRYMTVQTRAPKYHEGQYRLNFSGRVLTPSVKNMQLETDQSECLLQFGKVGENKFHLDFKVREMTQ